MHNIFTNGTQQLHGAVCVQMSMLLVYIMCNSIRLGPIYDLCLHKVCSVS